MFNYHYTEFVITDDSMLTDYSYICIEGHEHEFGTYDEAYVAADRLLAIKIKQYYNIYLESVDIPLYTLFDQIRDQRTLH